MKTDTKPMLDDDLMISLVAKWKGWKVVYYQARNDEDRAEPGFSTGGGGEEFHWIDDPRASSDEAIKLLAWLKQQLGFSIELSEDGENWLLTIPASGIDRPIPIQTLIPLADEPFRNAVCTVASNFI